MELAGGVCYQEGIEMDTRELQEKASQLGIDFGWSTRTTVLIRAIQQNQGDAPCFATELRHICQNLCCPWRADCLKPIAEWRR